MGIKTLFVTELDQVGDKELDNLGDLRYTLNGIYKYVQFSEAVQAGDLVLYNSYSANTVDMGSSGVAAGVVQADADADDFGWVKVAGYAELRQAVTGTPSEGDAIKVGGSDGVAAKWANPDASGDEVQQIGVFLAASDNQVILACVL